MPLRIRSHITYPAKPEPAPLPPRRAKMIQFGRQFVWTPDRDTALRLLWPNTMRLEIAARLGCSSQALHCRANFLGLPKTKTCPKKGDRRHEERMKANAEV